MTSFELFFIHSSNITELVNVEDDVDTVVVVVVPVDVTV